MTSRLSLVSAALAACLALAGGAVAQTAPPAGTSPPAATPPAATPPASLDGAGRFRMTEQERAKMREAARACRDELRGRDLGRTERREAMRTCVEARVPEIAARREAFRAERDKRRADLRAVRDQCRDDLRGRGLGRDERRTAMRACLVEKRPELAKPLACADQAREKGLRRGPERREFLRECMARA
jgi:hypothetical protein